ncbi:MAG: hypothetical protein HQK49_18030 [Oligoflexia bacterium]|nr:hypothetical protein [Oligoflexia bacterium]
MNLKNLKSQHFIKTEEINNSDFQKDLLSEFFSTAYQYLDKFEMHIFDFSDTNEIKHIEDLKMSIHALIGSALSMDIKNLANFLYKFDALLEDNLKDKSAEKFIDFYYFVVDKFRAYFYQLEHGENVAVIEKIILSTFERRGESEKNYLLKCIKETEDQLAQLKKALDDLEKNKTKKIA